MTSTSWLQLEAVHGGTPVIAALERAVAFGRFRAARRGVDPRLRTRASPSDPARRGAHRRAAPRRRPARCRTTPSASDHDRPPPPLPADLEAGLRRLRLSAIRRSAPELLVTAKMQRWKPEEFLRTLIEAEIASRDALQRPGPA